MKLNKVLAAIAGSALVVALGAMPSFAGSASGYRACSANGFAAVSSSTYSYAIHTHKYTADNGDSVTKKSPTARLTYGTMGPYKNAHWVASNGLSEAMKGASSSCVYPI